VYSTLNTKKQTTIVIEILQLFACHKKCQHSTANQFTDAGLFIFYPKAWSTTRCRYRPLNASVKFTTTQIFYELVTSETTQYFDRHHAFLNEES